MLVAASQGALAAAGFIDSARVVGGTSAEDPGASVEIRFNCKAQYLRHEPRGSGDRLRIYLDPTAICNGVSPVVAESRSRLRPMDSDAARLVDLEYDGGSGGQPVMTLNFSEVVDFEVEMAPVAFNLAVSIRPSGTQAAPVGAGSASPATGHRQVVRPAQATPEFVINLASFRRVPTATDIAQLELEDNQRLYYSEVLIDGSSWYRIRLGNFANADEAGIVLAGLKDSFPGAWVDQAETSGATTPLTVATQFVAVVPTDEPIDVETSPGQSKVDALMEDARKIMAAGDVSRAVQIYTKVLQLPQHSRLPEAQEYLALAREKKGQVAHAKAEYQRYLALYPNSEGAARVSQRLAVLLASDGPQGRSVAANGPTGGSRATRQTDWRLQTYFSQYYRRDVNQQNDQEEIVSQSALYSDVNFDARRRGGRLDFSSRISAGYRNDFLDESSTSGNDLRVSYAYADLADSVTGLRGRIGRQSRNTGGILGRFDGLNLGYETNERILVNAVFGRPAYSASDGVDDARYFYGASINYGPIFDDLEVGLFYIQQDIEGVDDRQAVGGEFRYFGTNQSFWGLVDYDTLYNELGSAFLQGSWRFGSKFSVHGAFDRRHSPFLSAGNALIGQPVLDFAQLLELYPVSEIQQLGLDRSPLSTTVTLGVSHSLSPRLQINADMNQTRVDATPESGGVAATPDTNYRYYSSTLVASSLIKEGDVTILGARYSDSDTSRVLSLTIDSRYPFGRAWRVNPRLRIDRRERLTDTNYEWLYTPGIRIQYRRSQKFRIELEAGKQFVQRDSEIVDLDLDRESYYINLGYQSFF